MPISKAPLASGKNADFYFTEAAKISLRGDLTQALEMLKKGLELKPEHFLCRFNHGVILFKLGLINEAISDFEILMNKNSKEAATAYNLAVCYL
jgi:tetratricopeptide (TPR) repeat protein